MSIYIPELREMPLNQMSQLAPDSRFSVVKSSTGSVSKYVYAWEDLQIVITVMPQSEVPAHLEGFIGWSRSVAEAQGRPLDQSLVRRIRSTSLVLGFIIKETTDREVYIERAQDLISIICYNTGALLFWEGFIYDENCRQLLP